MGCILFLRQHRFCSSLVLALCVLTVGRLQARLASGEDVFGPLIRRFLLDNRHRVTVEVWCPAKSLPLPQSKHNTFVSVAMCVHTVQKDVVACDVNVYACQVIWRKLSG